LVLSLAAASASPAAEKIVLDRATIVADSQSPSYVQYAVEDLAGYLKDLTGHEVPVATALGARTGAVIAVGPKTARQVLGQDLPAGKLGDEGYVLKSVSQGGMDCVIASGATPRGTKAAVAALMKAIRAEGKSAFVPAPLDRVCRPSFAKRGMHFNGWAFNYPHTFRSWREEDWQRYLDILSYQGVNLFYLWPFMEIMPVPLSQEDRSYLEECRRVVDYAQKRHGMEVWIMQCTNRVAKDRCGVSDPRRRPYWRPTQEDLNPGNPQHFQAIMASREVLYRIVNNVDGVCNIDSDPGYYAGSPLSDYVKVLQGCRALLDRHNVRGKEAKLVNWMWIGWGHSPGQDSGHGHQVRTIQALRQGLAEPWWLVSSFWRISACRQEGVVDRTVLLPYGVIEGEPSYPATNLDIFHVRHAFDEAVKYPKLRGMMGNVQTPILQLPHVYFFTASMWDLDYRKRPEDGVLSDLCDQLYPEHGQLLAQCYLALKEPDPTKIAERADRLEGLLQRGNLGRLGIVGRKLFPDHRIVAQVLLPQLRLCAARERLVRIAPTTPKAECGKLIRDYFDAYLAWDMAHGWHGLWGWSQWPLGDFSSDWRFTAIAGRLGRTLGAKAEIDACLAEVARSLSAKYDARTVQEGCAAPLKKAVLAAAAITIPARKAWATASIMPDARHYPPSAANDGLPATRYWPGPLTHNNAEWLQLTWDSPQAFDRVIVRFLQHPSMHGRTIHLQRETAPGKWEDFATTVIPADATAPHAVATFRLSSHVTLDKIRIVNLLDVFEVEVY
jgi:hypothetical protein